MQGCSLHSFICLCSLELITNSSVMEGTILYPTVSINKDKTSAKRAQSPWRMPDNLLLLLKSLQILHTLYVFNLKPGYFCFLNFGTWPLNLKKYTGYIKIYTIYFSWWDFKFNKSNSTGSHFFIFLFLLLLSFYLFFPSLFLPFTKAVRQTC